MQITTDIEPQYYSIQAYNDMGITIRLPRNRTSTEDTQKSDTINLNPVETYTTSLIITPLTLYNEWAPQKFDELEKAHFDLLLNTDVDLVIFGSGMKLQWPDPALLSGLYLNHIGIEIMDTGAACRTYNILMSDRRKVAAALLIS